ncbi:MAG: 1-deoxy-D-xylulose-5-phosphate reductoisomerase [Bauldia sp.]
MVIGTAAVRNQPARASAPRRITILGATGSIGTSTLDVIAGQPGAFAVEAVTANANAVRLARIARSTGARHAVIAEPAAYRDLKEALAGSGIEVAAGGEAVAAAATRPVDLVVAAIVGSAGLAPTYAAVTAGTRIALANKECLVSAGELFVGAARAAGVTILPVDSEHNAVFQILDGRSMEDVERITITASGGPFRQWTAEAMARATPAEALKHPRWSMGPKITVDSATLMNKGLELIEAHHLFGLTGQDLVVLVHPQAIVHGLVHLRGGAVLAALGPPDMRAPIAHCLAWPARSPLAAAALDLTALGPLTFEPPDLRRFPALAIARAALAAGGWATNILSAANEVAVAAFLDGRLGFLQIAGIVEETIERAASLVPLRAATSIEDAIALDGEGRRIAAQTVLGRVSGGGVKDTRHGPL